MPRRIASGQHRSLACHLLLVVSIGCLAGSPADADPLRDAIEADWQRQDEQRMAQIRTPGYWRFAETELDWAGVPGELPPRLARVATPQLDGRLDEPAWPQALRIAAQNPGEPELWLCRDEQQLYVGLSLPTAAAADFQGHFTARDAAGAVDGVKDGTYGFHTWLAPDPWWQVDLGHSQPLQRIVVYNRLDYPPGLHNADTLVIFTSDDGRQWAPCYDNRGRHFGGATSGQPLEVQLAEHPVRARYVRLQLPQGAPRFFHLDEVEIYGPDDPAQNLALGRPAQQCSLSPWSRGGQRGGDLFTLAGRRFSFAAGSPLGILADGQPLAAGSAAVWQQGQRTTAEIAIPLESLPAPDAVSLLPRQGDALLLDAQRPWDLAWSPEQPLGGGANRLRVELVTDRPLASPVQLQVETVVFTARGPERQTVFSQTLPAAAAADVSFTIQDEGAAALRISARQGEVTRSTGTAFWIAPVRETLERAARLLEESAAAPPPQLAQLRRQSQQLDETERREGAAVARRAALYQESRWLAREVALAHPLLQFDSLLLVKRFTQQTYPDVCLNHMPWCSRPGGDLCTVTPPRPDGAVRQLIDGQLGPGHVHGMDLWYDADRIVFGYARSPSDEPPEKWLNRSASYELRRTVEPTHIFELALDDGSVRQLTDGQWSDLDPTYLPSGEVAFASERCGYSLQCNELDKDETSCNLYVVDPDTAHVRRLTISKDGDYLPHTLDNGLLAYTRWEYQERLWANIQSIWVVRPDGSGADAVFKQHFNDPWALEDVRSIPGSHRLVAIATGHHTLATGPVVVVDPTVGINNPDGIRIVTPGVLPPEGGMAGRAVSEGGVPGCGGYYQTPWPLSEKQFLVSYTFGQTQDETGYGIYLIDVYGTRELLYRDPSISCSHPLPLRPRRRPPVLGRMAESQTGEATCVVTNVYEDLEGVAPGTIRYLRIAARLAWPYDNTYGGQRYEPDVKGVMINWTPARVIGTVPVEEDGSAHFRVPADTAVYFQALDERQQEICRMRSFVNFQPGETRGCTGCHETRAAAPGSPVHGTPRALERAASQPVPPSWGTAAMSFLRDVQPVLDRHCASCHGGLHPDGDIDLSGGLTAQYNRAWETINQHRLIARSNVGDDARVTPPHAFGSRQSKLVSVLEDATHAAAVTLARDDWLRLVTWIDLNGPYHASFLNKRPAAPSYNLATDTQLAALVHSTHQRRCAGCHQAEEVSRLDWIDIFAPAESRFLAAPLAVAAGGRDACPDAPYAATSDPDYQALLQAVRAAVDQLWQRPRRDLQAFLAPGRSEPVVDQQTAPDRAVAFRQRRRAP